MESQGQRKWRFGVIKQSIAGRGGGVGVVYMCVRVRVRV